MIIAKQSTARSVIVGPVLDADGVAVTDGVVADFKIAKNGAAPAALNGSATLTHRHTGFYSLALTTSDLDTVGQAEVTIDDTTNACPMKEITVIEGAVYDALFADAATGGLPVASGGITSSSFAAGAITAAAIATDAIDDDAISADAIAAINATVDAALADYDGPTNAELVSEINAVQADIAALNDLDAAGIRTALGLGSANLDTQLGALPTAAENADAVWLEALADHSGTSGSTAEALNASGSAGDPWATQLPGAYGSGSAGKIIGDNINATVGSRATQTSVDDVPTSSELTTALGTLNDLSASEVRDAVGLASANLDTQLADLPTGSELTTALSGLNDLDAAGVRAAVGLASADLDTQLGNIVADTNELQTDLADGGRLDLLIDAILDDTGSSGVVVAAASKTGYSLAAAGLDSVLIESSISAGAGLTNDTGTQLTSINARQALAVLASAIDGVLAGAGTGTITMKPAGKPSGNTRITATTSAGNRTAVTLKVPD